MTVDVIETIQETIEIMKLIVTACSPELLLNKTVRLWWLVLSVLVLCVGWFWTRIEDRRWIPVMAQIRDLRVIHADLRNADVASQELLVQYELNYVVARKIITSHLIVKLSHSPVAGIMTSLEAEYWLMQKEAAVMSPVRVWVNAINPHQIR